MSLREPDPTIRADGLTTTDLGDVLPLTTEVRDGTLFVGGVDMVELARTEGTALYVMDEKDVTTRLHAYRDALAEAYPDSATVYAGKAFTSAAMIRLVDEAGVWLDASSGGELELARRCGFPMEHVMLHGNNKTVQEIREAVDAGVGRFVVDTTEELDRIDEVAREAGVIQEVLMRITPGVVAGSHSYVQTGSEDSKFGFTLRGRVAHEALAHALELPNIDVLGFHMHIGSQLLTPEPFEPAIEIMAGFIQEVAEEFGFVTREFDVGGGFGIAYEPTEEPLAPRELCEAIAATVRSEFSSRELPEPRIYIEPGRSIVATAGISLYTVGSVKRIEGVRTYVNVDGGMSDNIRTALYDAEHEAVIANRADEPRTRIVTVAGKHCESGDVVVIDGSLQEPQADDILAVFSTGAYCHTMASNYNMQPRPAVFFVKDGEARMVIRRETYDDVMARECW